MEILTPKSLKTVPWFNRSEWELVYNLLYGDVSTAEKRAKALEIIKMWKVRTPFLPSGIEGTFIILQIFEKDESNLSLYDLQGLYSTAVLRFLNVCAAHNTRQGTFSSTAAQQNIPRWIINLRHDIAHGCNLPPIKSLKEAVDFSFQWLHNEYWGPVSQTLSDYTTDLEELTSPEKRESRYYTKHYSNVEFLIRAVECLTIFRFKKFKLKTIGDIPDEEMKANLLSELRWFGNSLKDVSENTGINCVHTWVLECLVEYLRGVGLGVKTLAIQLILEGDCFLYDQDLQKQMFESKEIENLPWKFVKLWQHFLISLQQLSLLDNLLYKLFEVVNSENVSQRRRMLASLWINEIGKGFQKLHTVQSSIPSQEINDSEDRKTLDIKWTTEIEKKYPELKSVLRFDSLSPISNILQDIKILAKVAFDEPNEFTHIFLSTILDNIRPPLQPETSEKLSLLVKSYIKPENMEIGEQIYPIENVVNDENRTVDLGSDLSAIKSEEESDGESEDLVWERAPAHISFQNVPFGVLPWQEDKVNPTIRFFEI